MDLSFSLQENNRQPLYTQIYVYLRDEIRAGRLRTGEKLPSSRALSASLHVARSTVDHAYSQLSDEGYILPKKNSGFYVCGLDEVLDMPDDPVPYAHRQGEDLISRENMSGNGRPGKPQTQQEGTSQTGKNDSSTSFHAAADATRQISQPGEVYTANSPVAWYTTRNTICTAKAKTAIEGTSQPATVIDFSLRRIDMSHFPYPTWRRIIRNVMSGNNTEMFERGDPQGDLSFRKTIADYLYFSRGVRCEPSQIIVGAGNDYLLMLLCSILGKNKRIAMENPSYTRAFRVFVGEEEEVVVVRQDEGGMSAEALEESGCDIAYCMPAHQYPTGVMLPFTRRMELLQWAAGGADRYLIEDDYDSEFRYRGKPVPALQSQDRLGKVIYLGTFSKSIAPAIRVSYMVLPRPLLPLYEKRCSYASSTVSRIDQTILNEFIQDGYFERYLNRMRHLYHSKHDLLLEQLRPLAPDVTISGADAGLHLILTWKRSEGAQPENQTQAKLQQTESMQAEPRQTESMQAKSIQAEPLRIAQKKQLHFQEEETLLQERALAEGVHVYTMHEMLLPGMPVPACPQDGPQVLLGYAALQEKELIEGAARLCRAWRGLPE